MKQLVNISTLILVLVFSISTTYGQENTKCKSNYFNDTLLDKLTGDWTAKGDVAGDKVFYNFSVKWSLSHQFLEMTFADTLPQHEYTANVFIGFDCPNDNYIVHWLDNFGGSLSKNLGIGKQRNQSVEIVFKYPTGQFINTFSYDNTNDTWTSHSVTKDKKGDWQTFGTIVLKRK